jgi:hypothetical protein
MGSGDILAFASQLLDMDGQLAPQEVGTVLLRLTQDIFDDYGITAALANWLCGDIPAGLASAVLAASGSAIVRLDTQPWDSDQSIPRDAGPYLLAPLLAWKIAGRSDDPSRRVFLRGLRMAFTPERQPPTRESRREGLEDVMSLLGTVPKALIDDAIRYAECVDDPIVRALCKLMVLT